MGKWDDEEADSSSPEETVVAGRRKFDDEEDDDDVLDSWDAAEDSEVEREKAKKAAEAKAKAEEEAKANKKSKAQRVADRIAERQRLKEEGDDYDDEDETEADKRARLALAQKEADLKHAEDLFGGDVGSVPAGRKATIKGSVVSDPNNPDNLIDLSAIPLFDPKTKMQFEALREVLAPILAANTKKPQYALFMIEFVKSITRDMQSDQIKKVASALTTLSNERMKEEKANAGSGKKSKAAKTKTTVNIARPTQTDTTAYDDDAFGDDDFM
ncbi:eukaryotic translation initiation factor 3 subunit J [Coniella lustricola]|uniref:Eukaryotic translation initiation factor 3 subunit J n=1 Tax=Coniella lustricola TaxID=2025994 RepID=A0A2T3ANH3_9PEZI|nr:eukaryotic translation initiation factor 3 subunit J [Coniella lustricola]